MPHMQRPVQDHGKNDLQGGHGGLLWHWDDYPLVEFLSVDDYIRAIESGLCNSGPKGSEEFNNDALMLWLMLWMAFNDIFRYPENDPGAIADPRYQENCRAILSEIPEDGANDPDILTLAEIYRNLGEFDECIRLLGKIADKDGFEPCISAFMEQCAARNSKTFQIAESEQQYQVQVTR